MRTASADAAPVTPFPFSTRTATRERGQIGCAGGAAGTATFACVAGVCAGAAAAGAVCACATGWTRCAIRVPPISASATSSAAASAPTTIVAVRQGNGRDRCGACSTARLVSPLPRRLLLRGERSPGRGEALGERPLRPPAELARGERDVEDAPLQLAEPCVRHPRRGRHRSPRGSPRRARGPTSRCRCRR